MKIRELSKIIRRRIKNNRAVEAPSDYEKIQAELFAVKRSLDQAYQNFSLASGKEHVDYYIYAIKSYETQYHLLLNEIRGLEGHKISCSHFMTNEPRIAQ